MRSFFVLIIFLFSAIALRAQQPSFRPTEVKILFLLDVSGSMNGEWDGQNRMDAAKRILVNLADSLRLKYPNVHFALRAFGADFPREQRNCKDSRLLVSFKDKSPNALKNALQKLTPRGMTPIAYSLEKATNDFPADSNAVHSIILITDGEENCDGDVCKAADVLMKKRISFRPFIVGMGVSEKSAGKFNCIGEFVNTHNENDMSQTVNVIIKRTLNATSAQINLLDAQGKPTVTNIPFTLYDSETGKEEYSFVHTLNASGNPDTLYLNPLGVYTLVVHSFPPVKKTNIELALGRHNLIALDVPLGNYTTHCSSASIAENSAQILVRNKDNSILNLQELVQTEGYLQHNYTVDVLTLPAYETVANVVAAQNTDMRIPSFGTLSLSTAKNQQVAVLVRQNNGWKKVAELTVGTKGETLKLQPAEYKVIYKESGSTSTLNTKTKLFTMEEGRFVSFNL